MLAMRVVSLAVACVAIGRYASLGSIRPMSLPGTRARMYGEKPSKAGCRHLAIGKILPVERPPL